MTFKELMNTAPSQKQGLMYAAIVQDGFTITTARSYATGDRKPKLPEQVNIQRHVKRIFGQMYAIDELFPAS
ncbi:MAG: hypothetical protein IKS71_04360 [Bacteroidales bacterium]|nr:hypothetical protein [Bacteroidales bacterium]